MGRYPDSQSTVRERVVARELARLDRVFSYVGWHAVELVVVLVVVVAACLFSGWWLLGLVLPVGAAAGDDLCRWRGNRRERQRRVARVVPSEQVVGEVSFSAGEDVFPAAGQGGGVG